MFRGFLPLNSVICNFAKCVLKNLLHVRTEEVSEEVLYKLVFILVLRYLFCYCGVLSFPPPAPAGRAGAGSSPAVKVRRSRWRWPAGPAADGGRWPESRLSGDRAADGRAAGRRADCAGTERRMVGPREVLTQKTVSFRSGFVLGAECNTLQLYSYFCLGTSFDGYS